MTIQHVDTNVGPKAYADLAVNELLVTKIFHTIQGEGPNAGVPAIFLRLAGCNRGAKVGMGCEFCDTAFQFAQGRRLSFERIWKSFSAVRGWQPGLLVITGGEPMMQNNLVGFISYLRKNWTGLIQIESNGDRLAPGFSSFDGFWVHLVVSPKVTQGQYRPLKESVLARASALKFVVSADPESPYHKVPEWAYPNALSTTSVYISPITVYRQPHDAGRAVSAWDSSLIDHEATRANYAHAARMAIDHGFRISLQTHLWLGVE